MMIHILGNPNKPSSPDQREDFFSYDVYKFTKHMKGKFKMIHYGIPGAKVDCKHIDLPAGNLEAWNLEANRLIGMNKKPGDIILCFYGSDNQAATLGHTDCKVIEAHIGYHTTAVFAPYRIFVSYAQMHYYYGQQGMMMNPSWWDVVIPNAMDVDEFEFKQDKQDYMVYLGRVQDDKGINIAIQTADKAKKKLIIAGNPKSLYHLGYSYTPKHVELVGPVNPEQRKELLANAMCLIAPTHYIEPFGNIVVEAHLSGTPTITSDWGGFVDTNIHGVTGYRCRLAQDFVNAVAKVDQLDKKVIRDHAVSRYSDEVIYEQMRQYILRVVRGDWYQEAGAPTPETREVMPEHARKEWDEIGMKLNQEARGKVAKKYFLPDEYEFSVIIPTMGAVDRDQLLSWIVELDMCPLVKEILIVDNSDGNVGYLNHQNLPKVRFVYSGENIYVNPAWNISVLEAKCNNVILANDDIVLEDITGILTFIAGNLKDGMIIGLHPDQQGQYELHPGHCIENGWGRLIAIKKWSYRPLPRDLKIWYGDDLLTKINDAYSISGVKGNISGSASVYLPEMKSVRERDMAIYPSLIDDYANRKRICHIIMSCGRPEYLVKTLDSLNKLDFGNHRVYTILVDDYPDGRDDKWFRDIAARYRINNLILNTKNKGLSKVWSDLWDMMKDMFFDYIVHQEDDVVLEHPFHIDDWIDILESGDDVCSAVLTRQKWYFHEEETQPRDDDEVLSGYRIEKRDFVFSPMMSLYRNSLTREGIKEKVGFNLNEGMIMQYLRGKGQKCAYIKTHEGHNMITHIGDWFHGKRVLPGEPNYEKFSHYDPDKFYCSKTGKPKQ
jgi:glycosyltransferase involved in cell wall biosynthesis/GT2 family glycosyltransferase